MKVDFVILKTVKSSMIMDVLHVNVDFILLPIEIVNQFNQDVLDIKMVFVKIVLLIINLKEVFVKFKDANNMKEAIVQNVQVNMIKLKDNVNLKIVSIGSMINVLPVKRDMF
jgi:isochorismate hydrolase